MTDSSNQEHNRDLIDKADVVSFDVFDTLLVRNTIQPRDIFVVARELFNEQSGYVCGEDFASMRVRAEQEARTLHFNKIDVTIDEIYETFGSLYGYEEDYCNSLKEFELLAEKQMLVRDPSTEEIYNYARKSGKTIVIISDMYLNKSYIEELLKVNEVYYDDIIVSSDGEVAKFTGSAYAALIRKYNSHNILHIGDNPGSDISWPEKFGIKTIHVHQNAEEASFETNEKLRAIYGGNRYRYTLRKDAITVSDAQFNTISGLSINYAIRHKTSVNQSIGYAVFGPALLGFVQWMHNVVTEYGGDHIFFLARDGAIMQQAYNAYYGTSAVANTYAIGSRRVLGFPASQYLNFSIYGVGPFVGNREVNIRDTLKYYNIDPDAEYVKDALLRTGLSEVESVSVGQTADQFKAALLLLEPYVIDNAKKESVLVKEYLDSIGLNSSKKPFIADIGWNGSMQEAMMSLAREDIEGVYFGLHDSSKSRRLGDVLHGYFDARKQDDAEEQFYQKLTLDGGVLILESLFTNPDQASIVGIEKRGKKFAPIESNYDLSESERDRIREMHEAALQFVYDYQALELPRSLEVLSRDNAFRAFKWMIEEPNDVLARIFGRTVHSDVVSSVPEYIGAPRNDKEYYQKHKSEIAHEYDNAIWKQGFRKNCEILGIPLEDA